MLAAWLDVTPIALEDDDDEVEVAEETDGLIVLTLVFNAVNA